MIFKIGEIDVGKLITPPKIEDTFRSQSIAYTLSGAAVIDRISEYTKKRITVEIPLIAADKWEVLKAVLLAISFSVTVDDTAYIMHLDGDLPSPLLYDNDSERVYSDIKLVFEEV